MLGGNSAPGYSLLSYAMMASDDKKFTSFQRAIQKSLERCKSKGLLDCDDLQLLESYPLSQATERPGECE